MSTSISRVSEGTALGGSDEKVAFVADARLISILGEQLIGSEKVGVLELVKNAYDAGAAECVVTLEGVPNLPDQHRTIEDYQALPGPIIEIRDDGSGMTREDIIKGWLRPATSRRASVKEEIRAKRKLALDRRSLHEFDALVDKLKQAHGGRLPLGEKGIGRLATHRLGRFLWLRTKTADDPLEWQLRVEWDRFDVFTGLDLSDVTLTLRHQPPTATYGSRGCGTVICCYGGRPGYTWTAGSITDVGRAVNALRSPTRAPVGFAPRFVTPHVADTALASPLDRASAPFELVAIVDESGVAEIEFTFTPPPTLSTTLAPLRDAASIDLRSKNLQAWKADTGAALRRPACGAFLIHVRAWLRLSKWMGPEYKELTEYLNYFGGLTVYRDGLAALPAQQTAKGDWLGLALAQIKKGTNISYYNLAGEVEIAQEHTLELRDRSSREGMIETEAYRDLVVLTKAVVGELQFRMQPIRDRYTSLSRAGRLPIATVKADTEVAARVFRKLVEDYDFAKDGLALTQVVGGNSGRASSRLREVSERLETVADQLAFQDEERDGLLEAAGFGLAIGVAVHEIARLASSILSDVRRLDANVVERNDKVLVDLSRRAESLLVEVRRLAPLRVTRSDTARPLRIRGAIEAARNALISSLREGHIDVALEGGDFSVSGRFGALSQVFTNLFDNSIYWIGTTGEPGSIRIRVSDDRRSLLIADSGPGISSKMEPHLFEPFFSEKSQPSGLGLYICRYYLGQCRASIRLASSSERLGLKGAQFVLDFSRSPAGEVVG